MKKALDTLQKLQIAVGGIMLAIFLVTVVFQMFSRYVGIVATWTEDVSMYSFIWAAFMGAGAMVHTRQHFAFTSISDGVKSLKVKSVLRIVITLVMLAFSLLMLYYGVLITKQFWSYRWNTIPSFYRGPVWMCVPICGGTSAIYLVGQLVDAVKGFGKEES